MTICEKLNQAHEAEIQEDEAMVSNILDSTEKLSTEASTAATSAVADAVYAADAVADAVYAADAVADAVAAAKAGAAAASAASAAAAQGTFNIGCGTEELSTEAATAADAAHVDHADDYL